MIARVAIDLALDRLFDYEVPEALERKLAVGQLLSVPFGHRMARGFVVEVKGDDVGGTRGGIGAEGSAETRGGAGTRDGSLGISRKLKPISGIVDETPFFSAKLLELVKKVAAYTAAPLESVLKAALPAAVLKKSAHAKEQLFVETWDGIGAEGSAETCQPRIPAVSAMPSSPISSCDPTPPLLSAMPSSPISSCVPSPPLVSTMPSAPISSCVPSPPLVSTMPSAPISSCDPTPPLVSAMPSSPILPPPKLTARQRWLLDQIVRLGGGWMQQLCAELKTTPATLRELAARGLVTIAPRQKRRDPLGNRRILPTKPLPLNDEQQNALAAIGSPAFRPILLYGITGSGKTEVYLQAIARELEQGRGAIVMVPEIALTPQTVQRFASRFGTRVAVLHSALSDGERYDEWHRIRSGEARVVVGPRSAVWAPVRDLGLIVVDEEHETSYKQDETPRYHARDVAVLRGAIEGVKVVLGSATPSLESWHNAETNKYRLVTMAKRAGAGTLPRVHIVDMNEGGVGGGVGVGGGGGVGVGGGGGGGSGGLIFSKDLLEAIRLRLDRHEQTILFLNRRGYSRSVICASCGYVVTCPACDVPYTYHRADRCLRCHICGGWIDVPRKCPGCGADALAYRGIGTQRAEAALKACFQHARVLRMDADSTSRKNSHDDILSAFRRGEADILLGTQMIAKGLDFPNVTLVGVLNADSSLFMPDFRAAERTYQLLAQVAGRAGRAELPGEVFIQTHDPSQKVIRAAARGDFATFAAEEMSERCAAKFPPYCHLAVIRFVSSDLKACGDWADLYARSLKKVKGLAVSDAMPSALEKADGQYRWQVIVRAATNRAIVQGWRWISGARPAPKNIRIALDADAINLV